MVLNQVHANECLGVASDLKICMCHDEDVQQVESVHQPHLQNASVECKVRHYRSMQPTCTCLCRQLGTDVESDETKSKTQNSQVVTM